nr:MAG TPA: hypothetical protein [Caudoviricetes sp.]
MKLKGPHLPMEYNEYNDTAILAEQTVQNAARLRDSVPQSELANQPDR